MEVKILKYYNFSREGDRNCDVRVFADKEVFQHIEETALQQLFDASRLPKIDGVVGMPDLHQGYGLPIGGVMASQIDEGIISPGAVGFDINCGVRLLTSSLNISEIEHHIKEIMRAIQRLVPAGIGQDSKNKFEDNIFKQIIIYGIPYIVNELGIGEENDINSCEDNGYISGAKTEYVPDKALERGFYQLGTLGSGNHFLEMQKVDEVYDKDCGLEKGQITFMIHTGSRGFGHQIAKEYTELAKSSPVKTPNNNLASFFINSEDGKRYLSAMSAAANYGFANRHIITDKVRKVVKNFSQGEKIKLYYGLTHNIAREEEIDGIKYLVHRKGAARLRRNDQALIPGSMGTASYLVKSMNSEAAELSYYSTAHGAGRKMSRRQAKKDISTAEHQKSMGGVKLYQSGKKNILDESPLAYKDIEMIINSLKVTGLAEPAARFTPIAVLKG